MILLEVDTKRANFGDDRFKNVNKYIIVQLETSPLKNQLFINRISFTSDLDSVVHEIDIL